MSVPWSRCGNYEPHERHYDTRDMDCPGWTARQQLVRHLVTSVREYMLEHYGYKPELPPGLRLEMHPSVRQWLMTDADLLTEGEWPPEEVRTEDFLPVPVKVTLDLKRDQWRLVIITEEVLLGGKAP
jgi:hypothetical protein